MSRERPMYKIAMEFCRVHLGKRCFAPLTGQDWSGWMSFVYLCELYGRGDTDGRRAAVAAMREVLGGVQNREVIHQVFVQTIPAVLDWSFVGEIWPRLLASAPPPFAHGGGTNWNLNARMAP